jgi:hypothetical protein
MSGASGARADGGAHAYDRARGGQLKVTLTIPAMRLPVKGNFGYVNVPERKVTFELDLERMPLVNVAGYAVDRVQVKPTTISYPNGTGATVDAKFTPSGT